MFCLIFLIMCMINNINTKTKINNVLMINWFIMGKTKKITSRDRSMTAIY